MRITGFGEAAKKLLKNKYVLCELLLGLVLLLIPTGSSKGESQAPAAAGLSASSATASR